ncbi:hypothetical protein MRX96_009177 [Rhipicephalus microplus]
MQFPTVSGEWRGGESGCCTQLTYRTGPSSLPPCAPTLARPSAGSYYAETALSFSGDESGGDVDDTGELSGGPHLYLYLILGLTTRALAVLVPGSYGPGYTTYALSHGIGYSGVTGFGVGQGLGYAVSAPVVGGAVSTAYHAPPRVTTIHAAPAITTYASAPVVTTYATAPAVSKVATTYHAVPAVTTYSNGAQLYPV